MTNYSIDSFDKRNTLKPTISALKPAVKEGASESAAQESSHYFESFNHKLSQPLQCLSFSRPTEKLATRKGKTLSLLQQETRKRYRVRSISLRNFAVFAKQ